MPDDRLPRTVTFVAARLGRKDGLSEASAIWQRAFSALGASVETVAGSGEADHLLAGLARTDGEGEALGELSGLLSGRELVVVENLCSGEFSDKGYQAVVETLAGRPAIFRHHDLFWQPSAPRAPGRVPASRWWRHVTVNERSRLELSARGIEAVTMYHTFDPDPPQGARDATRAALGIGEGEILLLQPTRAAQHKNVAGGLLLAAGLEATYWLLGEATDGYEETLVRLVEAARGRVVLGRPEAVTLADAYAASDVVTLPSTWEAFGNAAIESALHHRPLAIGSYPVATELRRYGFSWSDWNDPARVLGHLAGRGEAATTRNAEVARIRFSSEELGPRLARLLTEE